ncbi:MAG: substrate-binding domain-containing protein, partial [Bacilli bacterium]|nr:substrate-binding domain-containing protein [Bacilli bacterium]
MKRSKLFLALSTFPMTLMSLCSCQSRLKGAYVFMHKQSGNAYGMSVYKGVSEYLDEKGIQHADKSPSEQAVSNQVQMIENAAMLGAKAVIVSSSGEVGYDNVLKRVTEKGMKIVSVDSPISPKYRTMHVDQCDPQAIGSFVARSSVCIAIAQRLKETGASVETYREFAEYPSVEGKPDAYDDDKLIERTQKAIEAYKKSTDKNPIHIAIITSTAASPSQNEWIAAMNHELKRDTEIKGDKIDYTGVVDIDWMNGHIALGLDESVESTNKANALIEGSGNEKCDVIANVTSVACAACGEALSVHYETDKKYERVKMTGLGMPSEMWTYMPDKDSTKDALEYPCPYACLW